MKLTDKILGFFGLGYEDKKTANRRLYDAIKDDIPKIDASQAIVPKTAKTVAIDNGNLTPIEDMIVSYDPIYSHLDSFKTPGGKLRWIRSARKLTQQQLGESIGVSKSTIGDIETGRYETTSLKTACDIAERLGVKVTDIWTTILNK